VPLRVTNLDALPLPLQSSIAAGEGYANCPKCDGGSRKRQTLGLTYSDNSVVHLKCFRVTCSYRGLTLTDPNADFSQRKVKQAKPYREPTHALDKRAREFLEANYGIRRDWCYQRLRLNEDLDTLVISVRDPYGRTRGHITRTLYEKEKRVYTYKETDRPFLDYWIEDLNSAPVVVVEDVLSACRLSGLGYNAVALLGTGLSREDAKEIAYAAGDRARQGCFRQSIKATRQTQAHTASVQSSLFRQRYKRHGLRRRYSGAN